MHTKLAILGLDFIVGCRIRQLKSRIIVDLEVRLDHREDESRTIFDKDLEVACAAAR